MIRWNRIRSYHAICRNENIMRRKGLSQFHFFLSRSLLFNHFFYYWYVTFYWSQRVWQQNLIALIVVAPVILFFFIKFNTRRFKLLQIIVYDVRSKLIINSIISTSKKHGFTSQLICICRGIISWNKINYSKSIVYVWK